MPSQTWINSLINSQAANTAAVDAASAAIATQATALAGNADPTVVTAAGVITTQLALLNTANTVLKSNGRALPSVATSPLVGSNEVLGTRRPY